jgi:glycosyltransferase involved in cell wall biosynthesis
VNILHLEASTGWGGQEIRILREAEGMRERGHSVVFAVMPGAILGRNAEKKGFIVHEVNFKRIAWPVSLVRLLWILAKHNIELLNTHSSLDSWIGGIAGRIAGKKIVRTRHLSAAVKKGWNSRIVYGYLADFVVTTCQSIIDPIAKQSGKKKQYFRSIATGVEGEKIRVVDGAAAQFRRDIGADGFLAGTACFMRSWKGIEVFLKTADLLRDRKDLKWVIIGGGHEEKYRRLASEMRLEEKVHFTGHLENPFPALAALDAFLLLSTANEGVSQAILQAAYLKKPLIATPTGGLREVCLDGISGIEVPIFQPGAVANAILTLKTDPSLAMRLGQKAQELVLERFTFQQTLDGMEEIYRAVLSVNYGSD